MGKKTPRRPVDDYFTTIMYSFALTLDSVRELKAMDRSFWQGNVTANESIFVDERELFGGDESQGGVAGVVDFLMGDPDQILPAAVANKFAYNETPLTPTTAPGYRGATNIMFRGAGAGGVDAAGVTGLGSDGSIAAPDGATDFSLALFRAMVGDMALSVAGFLWGTNNPVLPPVSALGTRVPVGLDPATAVITRGTEQEDINPAHMIFELMTNRQFGAGLSEAQIDRASFEAAAQTLFDEGFGVTFVWTREDSFESVIADIQAHINGVTYIEPDTGQFTLVLFRDDFVVEDLPVFGPEELTLTDFDRKARGEIVNSFTVSYTNSENLEDETVTAVDEAGIAMQEGEEISGNANYHMVRNPDLAYELAERQLRVNAAPLAQGRAEGRRSLGILRPGSRFILQYPEYLGDETIVCRVIEVDFGKTQRPNIQVAWTEDIYALPRARTEPRMETRHIPPVRDPTPLDAQAAISLPYFLATLVPDLQLEDQDFPDTIVGLFGDQDDRTDTLGYLVFADAVDPSGTPGMESLGQVPLADRVTLSQTLPQEAFSDLVMTIPDATPVTTGDLILLGRDDLDETTTELALVLAAPVTDPVSRTQTVSVARGVLDTTPQDHPAGEQVWLLTQAYNSYDIQPRTAGVEVEYGLPTLTSRGLLSPEEVTAFRYTPEPRPYLPSRPANVTVGGTVQFGTRTYDPDPLVVPVSWSTRNRLAEDAVIRRWDEAPIVPEPGQTTRIDILSATGDILTTHSGLTGDSFDVPIGSFGPSAFHRVRVSSELNGNRSFQAHEILVHFRSRSGYGVGTGFEYGA